MSMSGFYIYCVRAKDKGGSRTLDFEAVPYRDVEAIVSRVALQDFEGPKAQKLLKDEQWLKERVLSHEQVVEEVMRRAPPLVPFKFGTVFRNREGVTRLLKAHYSRFQKLLTHLRGKQEWGVKMFSNILLLSRWVQQEDQGLVRFKASMKSKSAGEKYFLEKEFEARLDETVQGEQDKRAGALLGDLLSWYEERADNQIFSPALTGRADEMVLNVSLLVKEAQVQQLQQIISQWNRLHRQEGFLAELTGPWPPYNFAHL